MSRSNENHQKQNQDSPIISLDTEDTDESLKSSSTNEQHILELRSPLSYLGIAESLETGYLIRWNQYVISKEPNDAFMWFRLCQMEKKLRHNPDCGVKLHVALDPENLNTDPVNSDIQIAFNSVLKVLAQHEIETFKVILPSQIPAFLAQHQYGKIFTIYLGDIPNEKVYKIANAIERAIHTASPYARLKPSALRAIASDRIDRAITGCDFVTLALPRIWSVILYKFAVSISSSSSENSSVRFISINGNDQLNGCQIEKVPQTPEDLLALSEFKPLVAEKSDHSISGFFDRRKSSLLDMNQEKEDSSLSPKL